jgi:endonuclease YncB( thermonuclease family)
MPVPNFYDFRRIIVTAIAIACSGPAGAGQSPTFHEFTGKVVHIADGDTLTVLDRDKVQHKVRLHGIDAPEKGQAFGTEAKEALAEKVHERTVRVVWKEKDRYGRIVGDVWLLDPQCGERPVGNQNINIEMVRDGWAWWYRQYAPKSRALEAAEAEARKEKRGLWRDREPEPPWDFRRKERDRKSEKGDSSVTR